MGYRRLNIGGVDILVSASGATARRIRTLGGLLGDKAKEQSVEEKPPRMPEGADAADAVPGSLRSRVGDIEWYHTMDLGQGVTTPGWFDLRPLLSQYPLPERLDGLRVLDVATFDGFWAFELERRGAAEVVALDIDSFAEVDMPPRLRRQKDPAYLARKTGEGFALAREALGSKVRREVLSVYDLSPERLGKFDLVFISDVLLHLMNPMKALNNICSVTRGRAVIVDVFNPSLPGRLLNYEGGVTHNIWWDLSLGALEQMIWDAGFSKVELRRKIPLGYSNGAPVLTQAAFEAWA